METKTEQTSTSATSDTLRSLGTTKLGRERRAEAIEDQRSKSHDQKVQKLIETFLNNKEKSSACLMLELDKLGPKATRALMAAYTDASKIKD